MEYTIETKEAFQVVGTPIRVSAEENDHSNVIAKFWMEYTRTANFATLNAFAGELGLLGVMFDYEEASNEFTYMIAIEDPDDPMVNEFEKVLIPTSTWAIFKTTGSAAEAMPTLWQTIYTEWLPTSGYEQAETPALEVYPLGDPTDPNYYCEVWVPVVKVEVD